MSESWSEYHTNPGDHGLLRDYRYSDKGTLGSDGTGGCDYITAIDYSSTLTGGSYYFGQPKNVIVSKGDELFHCVSATYSSAIPTEVTSIRRALEFREGGNGIQPASGPDTHGSDSGLAVSCDFAETEYSYDPCGNLKSVRLPCPSSSDTTRVWYRYEYDNVLNTHLRKITDAFGLSNVSDSLDLRYGVFRQSQDRNNQYSWTSYDDLGRMTGVRTPFEDSYGNTVSFSYKPIADTANGIYIIYWKAYPMKRARNLMERIAHPDNLREAFLRAARGKSTRPAVCSFREDLDNNLLLMHRQLLDGSFRFGDYRFFTIYDPKRREICAASFPERVAFHAMMRICHPVFDDYQVYDSYASRIGKGTYAALDRARQFAHRYRWFAKLDVVKYFDSLDHEVLKRQLHCLFKDRLLLRYFDDLIDGYHGAVKDKGVPIGNLTSQYFANHYLAPADHYAKQMLRVPGMVRYMDDVLLFHDDKATLKAMVRGYQRYVADALHLEHHPVVLI